MTPLPYRRFCGNRKGVSAVVATVILSSTLLIIVLTASSFANQLLRGEIENTEFNQAKDVLSSLDKLIERVTSATGSSGYIRAGFLTTYPLIEATGKTLTIRANGTTGDETLGLNTTVVKIRGGRDVTGTFQDISGSSAPLVAGISVPLGWLYTNRTDAEEVVLDYSRARCVYKGLAQLWTGTDYETFNILEITVVSLLRGSISFKDTGAFVVQNKGLAPVQYQFTGNVQVEADYGGYSERVRLDASDPDEDLGGNPSYRTLLNFFVINVEVSVVQG